MSGGRQEEKANNEGENHRSKDELPRVMPSRGSSAESTTVAHPRMDRVFTPEGNARKASMMPLTGKAAPMSVAVAKAFAEDVP